MIPHYISQTVAFHTDDLSAIQLRSLIHFLWLHHALSLSSVRAWRSLNNLPPPNKTLPNEDQ